MARLRSNRIKDDGNGGNDIDDRKHDNLVIRR